MLKRNLVLLCLLTGCAAPVTLPAVIGVQDVANQTPIRHSFRPMAWDGKQLWQIVREPGKFRLVAQNLKGQPLKEVPLQNQSLPLHLSLTWGQDSLWLLDQRNTLHRLNLEGRVLGTLNPQGLSEPGGLEQIVWVEDQLWVLHRAYLDKTNASVPTRFYRLDPDSGAILAQLEVKDPAFTFSHTTLSADAGAFYVARGHIFDEKLNSVYRIDRSDARVSQAALGRIHTGLTSLFLFERQLFGIEMVDIDNCGELCRGQLLRLPTPRSR